MKQPKISFKLMVEFILKSVIINPSLLQNHNVNEYFLSLFLKFFTTESRNLTTHWHRNIANKSDKLILKMTSYFNPASQYSNK